MSAAKHTPAPWEAGVGEASIFGRRREDGGFDPIGFVYCPAFPERSEVGQRALADARLIAAVPDLLRELEHAVRWFDQLTPTDVVRYRAAIAKATGSAT